MKKTYLLLLLLSTASLKGFAQESQNDLLFRFLGTSEEQVAMTQDERIEETKSLYARIKEIKAAKKANLMNGLAAGLVIGASAVATGIEAGRQQQAANEAARAEQKARDEQRIAAARSSTTSASSTRASSTTTTHNAQAQAEAQRLRQMAKNTSDPNQANAYLLEAERIERTGTVPTQQSSANARESITQGATNINGTMVAVQLKVIYGSGTPKVTSIKLNNPRPDLNGSSSWYPVSGVTVQGTQFQYDGNISKDYSYKFLWTYLNNGTITIYFN